MGRRAMIGRMTLATGLAAALLLAQAPQAAQAQSRTQPAAKPQQQATAATDVSAQQRRRPKRLRSIRASCRMTTSRRASIPARTRCANAPPPMCRNIGERHRISRRG